MSSSGAAPCAGVSSRIGRLRPGERPFWLELPLSDDGIAELRWRAARAGQPVDALVALALEARIVDCELRAAGAITLEALHEQALAEGNRAVLAPTSELRAWVSMLRGSSNGPAAPDELPSVALPMRLVARVEPVARIREVLAAADADAASLDLARACDLAAALAGWTLEAWAYAAALRRLL
jgi:hypothetical protein